MTEQGKKQYIFRQLHEVPHWIPFIAVWNGTKRKWDKYPRYYDENGVYKKGAGTEAYSVDRTYSDALAVNKGRGGKRLAGLRSGCEVETGLYFACIDIDNCIDKDTKAFIKYEELIRNAIQRGYVEISLSGRGVHIPVLVSEKYLGLNTEANGIEIYSHKQKIILTGTKLGDSDILIADEDFFASVLDKCGIRQGKMMMNAPITDTPRTTDNIIKKSVDTFCMNRTGKKTIHEGGRNNALRAFAQFCYVNIADSKRAEAMIDELCTRFIPPLDSSDIQRQTLWARTCSCVLLRKGASKIIKQWKDKGENWKEIAKEIYAKKAGSYRVELSEKEITNMFDTAMKMAEGGKRMKKEKKQSLTYDIIENLLDDMGIELRKNVITSAVEIGRFPEISGYTGKTLTKAKDKNPLGSITLALKPYFRDKGYAGLSDTDRLIDIYADAHPYNPVHEMMTSQTWDGIDRIAIICDKIFKTNDFLERTYIKKWLWQTCAMAHNDAGEFDAELILTLQGEKQGTGKTLFFQRLTLEREDWLQCGTVINAESKDSQVLASQTWIMELGELDSTLKREQASLKGFTTQKRDRFRMPYDRNARTYTRRCSFCATVNPKQFLKESGRRWGVVRAKFLRPENVARIMTDDFVIQLWAQVYTDLYLKNPKGYHLSPDERVLQEKSNIQASEPVLGELEIYDTFDFDAPLDTWCVCSLSVIASKIGLKTDSRAAGKALAKIRKNESRIMRVRKSATRLWFMPPIKNIDWEWEKIHSADPALDEKCRAELSVMFALQQDDEIPYKEEILKVIADVREEEYGYFLDTAVKLLRDTRADVAETLEKLYS